MKRFFASMEKETLILIRDKAGLAILFLMPMFLIFVMTLIQDSTFKELDETQINILYLDLDGDSLGTGIENGLRSSGFFNVTTVGEDTGLNKENMNRRVAEGKFQIGILVESGATEAIRDKARSVIQNAFFGDQAEDLEKHGLMEPGKIVVYFDPVIKNSYKQTVMSALQNFTFNVEAKINFEYFADEVTQQLDTENKLKFDPEGGVIIEELYASTKFTEIVPNSVQHNVPAWTVFAMFFIIIPLTGNIIKERDSGSALRLRLIPGSYLVSMLAKAGLYVVVCLIQFVLMMVVGMYILPMFGTPALDPGGHRTALIVLAFAVALAATGYGIMLGTIATTHDQAASFGAVSVIILAALGGVWVPVFIMPGIMQTISTFSPLNWGLEGFYTIFLRGGGFPEIMKHLMLLIGFFILTVGVAFQYRRIRRI
jgi:ABC-2 type transport system permease protein